MKKTYINPELEVVKLQTMQMMATSVIDISDTPITEPSDIGGREFTFDVTASDEAGLIGKGTHKRFLVYSGKFLEKTQSKLK